MTDEEESNKKENLQYVDYLIDKLECAPWLHISVTSRFLRLLLNSDRVEGESSAGATYEARTGIVDIKLSEHPYVFRSTVEQALLGWDIVPELYHLSLYKTWIEEKENGDNESKTELS